MRSRRILRIPYYLRTKIMKNHKLIVIMIMIMLILWTTLTRYCLFVVNMFPFLQLFNMIIVSILQNHSESTFMNRSKVIAIPNKKLKPVWRSLCIWAMTCFTTKLIASCQFKHFHQALDDFYPLSDHDTPINTPKNPRYLYCIFSLKYKRFIP